MAIISIPTSVGGVALPGKLGMVASGPLSALYGSKAITQLNYPTELATDATKSHYVTFSIKQVVPAGYESVPQGKNIALGAGTANALLTAASAIGQNVPGVATATNALANGVKSVVSNIGSLIGPGATSEIGKVVEEVKADIKSGIAITPPIQNLGAVISLYMPDTITADYQAEYDPVSLQNSLGAGINSIRAIDQIATSAAGGAAGGGFDLATIKKVGSAVSSDPNVVSKIVDLKTGLLNSGAKEDNLGSILLQAKGYAFNPQMQMIYRGLPMRTFSLSFVFSPKSQQEALNVNQIIHTFKFHAAPTLTKGATASSESMFLIPPSIFNVAFHIKGSENKFLPKYADCVLENIDVNFAPNGFAAHTDGAPIQTTLNLQFREIEIVDRARLQTGFEDPTNTTGLR